MILILGLFLAAFIIYFSLLLEPFWQGPKFEIFYPAEGEFLTSTRLLVKGRGTGAIQLELNGRPIYTDESGYFEEELILAPGLNIIQLKALGRFGRELTEKRMVMVKLPE